MLTRQAARTSTSTAYPSASPAPAIVSSALTSPTTPTTVPAPAAPSTAAATTAPSTAAPPGTGLSVHLLGGPWVTGRGRYREVPDGSKRLLALLALDRRPLDRHYVSGSLWPDTDEDRAAGCLRTTLWRLRQADLDLVEATKVSLRLHPQVRVDVEDAAAWAERVLTGHPCPDDLHPLEEVFPALDLLPGWCDDWVISHRDRLRQRVLHALDAAARLLCERGDLAAAIDVASAAVDAEPLRESAQRVLIDAHLAEDNLVEARRAFARFAALLAAELQARPSPGLYARVGLQPAPSGHPGRLPGTVTRP